MERRERDRGLSTRLQWLFLAAAIALLLSLLVVGGSRVFGASAQRPLKAVEADQDESLTAADTYVDISIQPSTKTIVLGDSFSVQIYVDPNGQPVDTVDARAAFDPDLLQVQSVVGSSAGLADQLYSAYDNDTGTVTHSRGQLSGDPPTSGFTLCTITFQASAATDGTKVSLNGLADAYYAGLRVLRETIDGTMIVEETMQPLTADFVANPVTGTVPLTVTFTDQSTGDVASRAWAFGDNATSTQESPTYTYSVPGVYSPTLTVSGADGSDTLTRTDYITAYHRADLNQDCQIDALDLQVVTGKWRCVDGETCYDLRADLDADRVITVVDIMRLVAAWGWSCQCVGPCDGPEASNRHLWVASGRSTVPSKGRSVVSMPSGSRVDSMKESFRLYSRDALGVLPIDLDGCAVTSYRRG